MNNFAKEKKLTISQAYEKGRVDILKEIAERHFDKDLGTYDYDGIAEEVLEVSK